MDKRILAYQFLHFRLGKELERGNLLVRFHSKVPGLAGLVQFPNAISRSIGPWRHQAQMHIEVEVAEDLQVQAEPVELVRVLSNLLENAKRYGQSPSDGITRDGSYTVTGAEPGAVGPDRAARAGLGFAAALGELQKECAFYKCLGSYPAEQ